jgi:alanyl-tRNA synthetase
VERGVIRPGAEVTLAVDEERRHATERNHTATHLLHRALRERLGTTVEQSGSLVAPDRLTFDFTHHAALTPEDLEAVEREVNRAIRENDAVSAEEHDLEEAKAMGAMALFGEKYGDRVRVVGVGDYSTELCGGTHVARSGDIGAFRILRERSVAAGIRRIEAVTGAGAVDRSLAERADLTGAARQLGVKEEDLPGRLADLLEEMKELRKAAARPRAAAAAANPADLLSSAVTAGEVKIVAASVPGAGVPELRTLCDGIRKLEDAVAIALLAPGERGLPIVVAAGPGAVSAGFDASAAMRAVTAVVGGGGGGKPDMAQGKGKDAGRAEEALEAFRAEAGRMVGGA